MEDTKIVEVGIVQFDVTEAALEQAKSFNQLVISNLEDKEQYKAVYDARIKVKAMRVGIEKRRKELKAFYLAGGKAVDVQAKGLTATLEPIEAHLQAEQDKVDAEKERLAQAKKEAEGRMVQERLDQVLSLGGQVSLLQLSTMTDLEFSELLSSLQQANEERIRAEQEQKEAEAKAQVERKAIEEQEAAARAEELKKQQEALAEAKAKADEEARIAREAQKKIDAENAAKAAELAEQQAKIAADAAALQAEKDRIAALKIAEQKAAEAEELAKSGRSDLQKINALIGELGKLDMPNVQSSIAKEIIIFADLSLVSLATELRSRTKLLAPQNDASTTTN